MTDAAASVDSVTGPLIHDVVDYLQEIILQDRRARSKENWETLVAFWKICKSEDATTERLIVRQQMCKILVFACAVSGYDVNSRQAMINWTQEDWETLMKQLVKLIGADKPYEDRFLKELYIACLENKILAKHRRLLEDDIKHKRETVSLSAEDQKKFQDEIKAILKTVPDGPCERVGMCMTKLHDIVPSIEGDDSVLILLSPTDLGQHFCVKPFLFDWVILKIEAVLEESNQKRFNGQTATLWTLGYVLPKGLVGENGQDLVNEGTGPQSRQSSPATRTPARRPSPLSRQNNQSQYLTPRSTRATPSSSQDEFLQQHPPVVLGSVRRVAMKSPPNNERKRNHPAIFDEAGKVKFRRRWTEAQTQAIIKGLRKYRNKTNKWALILKEFPIMFEDRTSVMVKDRCRTLKRLGRIPDDLIDVLGRVNDAEEVEV